MLFHNQSQFEALLQTQIPIAWMAGVRFESLGERLAQTYVRYEPINQNPFGSMFWAVQAMAAEFAGGMLLLRHIAETGYGVSTLVVKQESRFFKKALGKIVFSCSDVEPIADALRNALKGPSASVVLNSVATNEAGETVADFAFTWSLKLRNAPTGL